MRKLVLTLAIGEAHERLAEVTQPTMRAYAEKIGADFRCLTERTGDFSIPWEKFALYDILGKWYDRVIFIDNDAVVRPDCPDLFEVVPENKVGAFNEGLFIPREMDIREGMRQYNCPVLAWEGKYYNTGVLVVSRQHRHLFKHPVEHIDNYWEQTYFNIAAIANRTEFHDIRYECNYMPSMQAKTGFPMESGYIAHVAGSSFPDIARDHAASIVANWQRYAPDYKFPRKVWVDIGGGLGDVIDAEPVLRYIVNEVYPHDDVRVTSPWPRVFQGTYPGLHLQYGSNNPFGDAPVYKLATLPDDAQASVFPFVTHVGSNATDFASIVMLHCQMPHDYRQIQLTINDDDRAEIDDLAGDFPLDKAALIHAGRSWASRTFPVEWWQSVIDGIAEHMPVCLFGLQGEIHGVLPVEARDGVLDLRDRTTMGGMFELVRRCPVLLTNDSSPVHVAGAFDNQIVLIPSARHPDLVLPWRGSPHPAPYYKAVALYKRLTIDDIDKQPAEYYGTYADAAPQKPWTEYLPEISDVVNAVCSAVGVSKNGSANNVDSQGGESHRTAAAAGTGSNN